VQAHCWLWQGHVLTFPETSFLCLPPRNIFDGEGLHLPKDGIPAELTVVRAKIESSVLNFGFYEIFYVALGLASSVSSFQDKQPLRCH